MAFILQYIDAIWLFIAFFAVHKDHRRTAVLFVFGCMALMRMQAELMVSIGYPNGILFFMDSHVFNRGLVIYTVCYLIYLAVVHFSAKNDKSIVMASSIGMFFMVFFASSVLLML